MVSYVDLIGLYHSVEIFGEIYVMQPKCPDVAVLPFQAHANNGTRSDGKEM